MNNEECIANGPSCDMAKDCCEPVTHIDSSGFAYCAAHGASRRRSGRRCRKLRPHEIRRLGRGQTIASY